MTLWLWLAACAPVVPIEATGTFEAEVTGEGGLILPITVWYPAALPEDGGTAAAYAFDLSGEALVDAPPATGPFPVVLFSHGNGGGRHNAFPILEAWARAGYVVLSVDHVGNTFVDSPSIDEWVEIYIRRPADLEAAYLAAIGWSEDDDHLLAGRLDPERLAVSGHSTGGSSALLASGAGIDRAPIALGCAAGQLSGTACTLADETEGDSIVIRPAGLPPVGATLLLAPLSNGSFQPAGLGLAEAPSLVVVGDRDDVTPLERDARPIYQGLPGPSALAVLEDAGHYGFAAICDVPGLALAAPSAAAECGDGWMAPQTVLDLTTAMTTAWLDATLKSEDDPTVAVEAAAGAGVTLSLTAR